MVADLDFGYREDLWLRYKDKAKLGDLLEAFKAQWKNPLGLNLDVIATASGSTTIFSIEKAFFLRGLATATVVVERISEMVCLVTLYTRAASGSFSSPATKLIGEIIHFIKGSCANLVRVVEGPELSSLKARLLEKPSLLKHLRKAAKERRESPSPGAQPSSLDCPVCQGIIEPSDEMASCPYCHMHAHKMHLLEWIHVKGSCPSCGRGLRADQVKTSSR